MKSHLKVSLSLYLSVFSLHILIGGDFRIIDGEKIFGRELEGPQWFQCKALLSGGGGSTSADFLFGEF
jgi:hypothetical protein